MSYFKTDVLKKEFQNFTEKVLPKSFGMWFVQKNIHASSINNFY